LGFFSNGYTFGTGYQETKAILEGNTLTHPLYPFFKMLATCFTVFSGIPAGIFVPSIAAGAGLGVNLAHWFPVAQEGAMILLTMSAYFSGMLRSPITAFVIVMEMTNSHEIMIPLMTTAFIAAGTSKMFNPVPLYRALSDSYKSNIEKSKKTDGN
jgi:H+/Cl- antiporter ClcA